MFKEQQPLQRHQYILVTTEFGSEKMEVFHLVKQMNYISDIQ
jgi:hypothetical protein